jgi:hypothetical protein
MKLNDKDVISYEYSATSLSFILNCSKEDALTACQGKTLVLKAGTSIVGTWSDFTVTGVVDYESKSGTGDAVTYTRLTAARQLSPDTEAAIRSLESNLEVVRTAAQGAQESAQSAQESAEDAVSQVGGVTGSLIDVQAQLNALVGNETEEEAAPHVL